MKVDENKPIVEIVPGDMEAYLVIPIEGNKHQFTFEELMTILASKNISMGIDEDVVREIAKKKLYGIKRLVALGREPKEGEKGYYEYLFNAECSKKPEILPDGSVNYHNMNVIESVQEGDVIAVYHPAVEGTDGFTIKGKILKAKPMKNLPPLKGKGFTPQEDGVTYCATLSGKIDKAQGRIIVSPIYEIRGDVDLNIGNIDFRGDVIIHGSIRIKTTIRSTGTITVDGIVDSEVNLVAKKDIVLKSGMMENHKSTVVTKGNLYCKFIEYSTLEVNGKIEGEAFLNCNITCGNQVVVVGKKGRLVGGVTRAVGGIIANSIGSRTDTRTEIQLGMRTEQFRRLKLLEKKIDATKLSLKRLEDEKHELKSQAEKLTQSKNSIQIKETAFLRKKIKETAVLNMDEMEMEELNLAVAISKGAVARILRKVYPGVSISIDNVTVNIKEEQVAVEFSRHGEAIRMEKL